MTARKTVCPWCLEELIVDNGRVVCADGYELPDDISWDNETAASLQLIIEWQIQHGYASAGDSWRKAMNDSPTCDNINCANMIEELTADLSVARQSLYKVVGQRNSLLAEGSGKDEDIRLLLAVSDAARDLHKSITLDLHKHDGWHQFDFTADPVDLYWVHHLRLALQALDTSASGRQPHIVPVDDPVRGHWNECSECGEELGDVTGQEENGLRLECGHCGHQWWEGEYIEPTPADSRQEPAVRVGPNSTGITEDMVTADSGRGSK